jgi:hypothetical protein
MTETPTDLEELRAEGAALIPAEMPRPAIFAYNVSEGERPGGIKVRWKVRVAEGAEAARVDARVNEAIRELLAWSRQHRPDSQGR